MKTHTINLTDEQATLSPAWVRKVAQKPNAVILVAEPKLSMLADALEIADESAESLITSETLCAERDHETWRDLATVEDIGREGVAQAVRYLEARGLLIKHATVPQLVRFKEPAE